MTVFPSPTRLSAHEKALGRLTAYIKAQPTRVLAQSLVALGDPPAGSAERVAMMHTCDCLEKRHGLTDMLDKLADEAPLGTTYSELVLLALSLQEEGK